MTLVPVEFSLMLSTILNEDLKILSYAIRKAAKEHGGFANLARKSNVSKTTLFLLCKSNNNRRPKKATLRKLLKYIMIYVPHRTMLRAFESKKHFIINNRVANKLELEKLVETNRANPINPATRRV